MGSEPSIDFKQDAQLIAQHLDTLPLDANPVVETGARWDRTNLTTGGEPQNC